MKILRRILASALIGLVLVALAVWGTFSFVYCSWAAPARCASAGLYIVSMLLVVISVRPWRRMRNSLLGIQGAALAAFFLMSPSNDRDWQEPVARLAYADVDGDLVTFHNIRDFDYVSPSEFTPAYYDKSFRLSEMESVDVYLVNWGIKQISHTMLSFGFAGDDYLCVSFETRKEKGESYSMVKGFFRKYEMYAVVADERDAVRLRTNYRKGEDVYLYRLKAGDQNSFRRLFLSYVELVNALKDQPDWYNAATDNCNTTAYKLGRMDPTANYRTWHWKVLLNGYLDELGYERGSIDTSLPFAELKKASRINDRALAAEEDPDFSRAIRVGLPGITTTPPPE